MERIRCPWVPLDDPLYLEYHDKEWGTPLHDDQKLFEFLVLEGFQAGLSWRTVLYKRQNFRAAFDNFNPRLVAAYDEAKIANLLQDPGIIRNKLKVRAAVTNAQAFLALQDEYGTFDEYIWRFVGGAPIQNTIRTLSDYPATSAESDALSADLKKRGFKFVGSTICYAHMQATGMVNDHALECYRREEVINIKDRR